jgi:hypothetical protein
MNYSAYEKINLKGFLIDFFGILVPGLLFIVFSLFTLGWPILIFTDRIYELLFASHTTIDVLKIISSLNTTATIEVSILILMVSYVIGTIFFRRDPKLPDENSYKKCVKPYQIKDPTGWVVREDKDGLDIQYPYRYLYEYLMKRNLLHLAKLVPWKGTEPNTYDRRTKIFINMLKARLEFYFPEKCDTIIKNEAQIRLMSSLWYVATSLITFSFIGIFLLVVMIFCFLLKFSQLPLNIVFSFLLTVFVIINSYLAKLNIQKFFHYMRVREVVIVLENVYVASKEKPEIIDGIIE